MILSFKKFDNLLLYLNLEVGVNFMNSQHLRLKWHFEKLDKYGPWSTRYFPVYLVCKPCLVLPCPTLMSIKYYYLSLSPRLRVLVPPSCVHRDTETLACNFSCSFSNKNSLITK